MSPFSKAALRRFKTWPLYPHITPVSTPRARQARYICRTIICFTCNQTPKLLTTNLNQRRPVCDKLLSNIYGLFLKFETCDYSVSTLIYCALWTIKQNIYGENMLIFTVASHVFPKATCKVCTWVSCFAGTQIECSECFLP